MGLIRRGNIALSPHNIIGPKGREWRKEQYPPNERQGEQVSLHAPMESDGGVEITPTLAPNWAS